MSSVLRSRRAVLGAAVVAGIAAAAAAPAQTLPPAEQILERYVEATGGRAAYQQHDYLHMVTEMSMPAAGIDMSVEVFHARPNLMLTRMAMPGMGTMTTGFDGSVAWAADPVSGGRIITDVELEQMLRQADFDSSIAFERHFPTIETVERTEMAGSACYMVRMVSASDDEVLSCFDVETGLMVGSIATQVSPLGEIQAEITFGEYREFDGIRMPTVTRMNMMGQEMVMTVREVSHAPFDRSVFELPAQVRALVP